jgi:hypothetical protein
VWFGADLSYWWLMFLPAGRVGTCYKKPANRHTGPITCYKEPANRHRENYALGKVQCIWWRAVAWSSREEKEEEEFIYTPNY